MRPFDAGVATRLAQICLAFATLLVARVAAADPVARDSLHGELSYNLRVDLPLLVGGYVSWNALQALNKQLAARDCRWCDRHLNGVDSSARSALRWSKKRDTALLLSDLGANAFAPAATIGVNAILAANDRRFASVPVDFVVTEEAVELAGIVTQIVKYSVGRTRPATRALPADERPRGKAAYDDYVSFWSGHTSYAFSLASAAGTVAWLRDYRGYVWVWIGGMSVAATTAYFRIAADQHYLTDVLSGAAAASAIGFAVPFFFHHPIRLGIPVTPSVLAVPGGAVLALNLF